MHAWHDVPWGADVREFFHAVIEIPEGSKVKYELDKVTGLLRADRILYSAVHYPANYGFIPQSYCGDGDPLDVLLLCQVSLARISAMRSTRSASTHNEMCAQMRCGVPWNTGRVRRPDFMVCHACSTRMSCW